MNKNTKQARAALEKAKSDIVWERTKTVANSSNLSKVNYTLHYGRQKQLSSKGKVGNCKGGIKKEVEEIFAESAKNS